MLRARRLGLFFIPLTFLFAILLANTHVRARAEGVPVFINQDGMLINGTVRILCFESATPSSLLSDQVVTVTNGAQSSLPALPAACSHLAAMQLRHTQAAASPTHGPAYWIYTTSWQPGSATAQPSGDTIVISDDNPLTLFNVVASIGWEPASDSSVLTTGQLQAALLDASDDIYDWTEGRAAFGSINIETAGQSWTIADMRFMPNNDQRPGAYVGGIVSNNLDYATSIGTTTYVPGTTFFGRSWNGNFSGSNGASTIAHEWMHYAFFLYDEYVQSAAPGRDGEYCVCNDLDLVTNVGNSAICGGQTSDLVGSALAYHYTASELWHIPTHSTPSALCTNSQQFQVHAQSDWETLERWGDIQNLGLSFKPFPYPSSLLAGPDLGLTRFVVDQAPPHNRTVLDSAERSATAAASEPLLALDTPDVTHGFTSTLPSQVYLFKGSASSPESIQYQGRAGGIPDGVTLGNLRLLGVDSADAVRAYADEYAPSGAGRSLVFPSDSADSGTIIGRSSIEAAENAWVYKFETDIGLLNSRPQTMTVHLLSQSHDLTSGAKAQLCSQDATIGCLPLIDMTETVTPSLWTVELVANELGLQELPLFSIVRIVAPAAPYPSETVRWVQLAGSVGPAYIDGLAPLVDDRVMVLSDDENPNPPDCNYVSFMPATNVVATQATHQFTGIIGQPLDITMVMANAQGNCVKPPPCVDQYFDNPVTLLLFFDPAELARLNIDASQLGIGSFDEGQSSWNPVNVEQVNAELGFVAGRVQRDGIFMVTYNRPVPTGDSFIHSTTSANSSGPATTIDHPALNNNKAARLIVTHNWNPFSVNGTYHNHNIGVDYNKAMGRWQLINQDMVAMNSNIHFNILVAADSQTAFRHSHNTAQNAGYDETYLDDNSLNFLPWVRLFFTQSFTPSSVYNNRVTGAAYDNAAARWVIQNSLEIEFDPVPNLAAYNVLVPTLDQESFVHTATASNTGFNLTEIDHPLTNGNPDALVFITPRWPFSNSPLGNWHPTGVFYSYVSEKWAIYNEDQAAMPIGSEFNVLLPTQAATLPTAVGLTAPTMTGASQSLLFAILLLAAVTSASIAIRLRKHY